MTCNRVSDQAKHTDRSVKHDIVGHPNHDVADFLEEVCHHAYGIAHKREAETEEDGEEDNLKHVAFGKSFDRVNRDDIKEDLRRAGAAAALASDLQQKSLNRYPVP